MEEMFTFQISWYLWEVLLRADAVLRLSSDLKIWMASSGASSESELEDMMWGTGAPELAELFGEG